MSSTRNKKLVKYFRNGFLLLFRSAFFAWQWKIAAKTDKMCVLHLAYEWK